MFRTDFESWKHVRQLLAACTCVASLVGCGGGQNADVAQTGLNGPGKVGKMSAQVVAEPAAVRPLPTERQIKNLQNEVITFAHFGINTFNGRQWGDKLFTQAEIQNYNPTQFNAKQWIDAVEDMGSNTFVFVTKHHDGFANWRSDLNPTFSMKATPFQRDLVQELYNEADARGMKFGLYVSTWDYHYIHSGKFGNNEDPSNTANLKPSASAAYLEYYKQQFRELKAIAPKTAIIWLDGAGRDRMQFTLAQNNEFYRFLYELFPGVVLQCTSVDIHWIGNEHGDGYDKQWNHAPKAGVNGADTYRAGMIDVALPAQDVYPINYNQYQYYQTDLLNDSSTSLFSRPNAVIDSTYRPLQADAPILAGWFWDAVNNQVYYNPEAIYWKSVGKGAQLILNYSPDNKGVIPENQIAAARRMRLMREATFKTNLLKGATVTASSTFADAANQYGPEKVLDGNLDSYWATPDGTSTATLTFTLPAAVKGDVIELREYLVKGQRIGEFKLSGVRPDGSVVDVRSSQGQSTIGSRRLLKLDQTYELKELRVEVKGYRGAPLLSEVGFYKYAALPSSTVQFSNQNAYFYGNFDLEMTAENVASIYYTLDGSTPTTSSTRYTGPVNISNSTVVKAITNTNPRVVEKMYMKLAPALNSVNLTASAVRQSSNHGANSGTADKAIDGDLNGNFFAGHVTHTADTDKTPWWEADLGTLRSLDVMKIYNRTDCCTSRLEGARIVFSPTPFASTVESEAVAQAGVTVQTLTGVQTRYTLYPNINARYVRIYGNYGQPLSLAEVQFFDHSSAAMPFDASTVTQSTTHSSMGAATKAIDGLQDSTGNFVTSFFAGGVTHTADNDTKPWWEGGLQNLVWMDTIEIYNRTDCCKDRLAGVKVYISNEPFISTDELQVANQQGRSVFSLDGVQDIYRIKPARFGKYIRIHSSSGKPLSIAEIVVKGSQVNLSALPGRSLPFALDTVTQSSVHSDPTKAVDGVIDGTISGISHTGDYDTNPWWSGGLTGTNWVSSLQIYNRTDCCMSRLNGAKVYISNKPFPANATEADVAALSSFSATLGNTSSTVYTMNVGQFARYVRIYGKNGPLHMAEVVMKGVSL